MNGLSKAVVVCRGELSDPGFSLYLAGVKEQLQSILHTDRETFLVSKLERWNSVRVTFHLPPAAARRLARLAVRHPNRLCTLGISSVQVDETDVVSVVLDESRFPPATTSGDTIAAVAEAVGSAYSGGGSGSFSDNHSGSEESRVESGLGSSCGSSEANNVNGSTAVGEVPLQPTAASVEASVKRHSIAVCRPKEDPTTLFNGGGGGGDYLSSSSSSAAGGGSGGGVGSGELEPSCVGDVSDGNAGGRPSSLFSGEKDSESPLVVTNPFDQQITTPSSSATMSSPSHSHGGGQTLSCNPVSGMEQMVNSRAPVSNSPLLVNLLRTQPPNQTPMGGHQLQMETSGPPSTSAYAVNPSLYNHREPPHSSSYAPPPPPPPSFLSLHQSQAATSAPPPPQYYQPHMVSPTSHHPHYGPAPPHHMMVGHSQPPPHVSPEASGPPKKRKKLTKKQQKLLQQQQQQQAEMERQAAMAAAVHRAPYHHQQQQHPVGGGAPPQTAYYVHHQSPAAPAQCQQPPLYNNGSPPQAYHQQQLWPNHMQSPNETPYAANRRPPPSEASPAVAAYSSPPVNHDRNDSSSLSAVSFIDDGSTDARRQSQTSSEINDAHIQNSIDAVLRDVAGSASTRVSDTPSSSPKRANNDQSTSGVLLAPRDRVAFGPVGLTAASSTVTTGEHRRLQEDGRAPWMVAGSLSAERERLTSAPSGQPPLISATSTAAAAAATAAPSSSWSSPLSVGAGQRSSSGFGGDGAGVAPYLRGMSSNTAVADVDAAAAEFSLSSSSFAPSAFNLSSSRHGDATKGSIGTTGAPLDHCVDQMYQPPRQRFAVGLNDIVAETAVDPMRLKQAVVNANPASTMQSGNCHRQMTHGFSNGTFPPSALQQSAINGGDGWTDRRRFNGLDAPSPTFMHAPSPTVNCRPPRPNNNTQELRRNSFEERHGGSPLTGDYPRSATNSVETQPIFMSSKLQERTVTDD